VFIAFNASLLNKSIHFFAR